MPDATRVLVIDDDPGVLDAIRKTLCPGQSQLPRLDALAAELRGEPGQETAELPVFEVIVASQGSEGVQHLEQLQASGQSLPEVAIVDMRMPPGWDGVETVRRLWDVMPGLQVIICTAYSDYTWPELLATLGSTDDLLILRKPFESVELRQMVLALGVKWRLRRQAEERRRSLETLLREHQLLLEHASDFVYRVNPDGTVSYVSPAFQRLFDLPVDAWRERRASLAAPGTGNEGPHVIDVMDGGKHLRRVEIAERPLTTDPEPSWVGTGRDVTRREALEAELRRAQKMEALGRVAGGVAHDFNNLLTAIGGAATLLRERGDNEEVAGIIEATRQGSDLTRQLRLFSREVNLTPEPVDVSALIRESATLFRRVISARINLTLDLETAPGRVKAPRSQLASVLMNLVVNAADAMPDGGTLTLRTRNVTDANQGVVQLIVTDTGSGMTGEVMARAFEPFFTTKTPERGTGLGLAVVHGVVETLGGRVRISSTLGEGTRVEITFPRMVDDGSVPGLAIAPLIAPPAAAQGLILLVEDNDMVAQFTERILRRAGFTVHYQPNSEAAAALAPEILARVTLLLSDVVMPGLTGPQLYAVLAARKPGLPVVFVSGYSPDDLRGEAAAIPSARFVHKPWTQPALLQAIQAALADATPG